jgi:hypothetical protein
LTAAQARATIDWLLVHESHIPQPDRTYDLHSAAPVEASNVLEAWIEATQAGLQNDLELAKVLLRGDASERSGEQI